ncbi:MAG: N-acetyltransferase [Hyphomicrobiales bacterium]|nr:N-acetyltransferase [Hyphomicrobiales bacterium]MDE2017630.1 N-acetyltransferase [Hyphomicrobiales bacterium]
MSELAYVIEPERPDDAAPIERLSARAFGPGRFARSAYRLREKSPSDPTLSRVARIGSLMIACNAMTPISIGGAPALLLGPLVVEPAFRRHGVGAALIRDALAAAAAAGHRLVLLVGDEPFYGRFGFKRAPPGRLEFPGPVDPARLLVCELVAGAFEGASGAVGPA